MLTKLSPCREALRAPAVFAFAALLLGVAACSTVQGSGGHASVNGTEPALPIAPTMTYERAADEVWDHVKATLVHLSAREPRFENDKRKAFATLDDGSVQVEVFDRGEGMTEIMVRARRYGVKNAALGAEVLQTIDEQIVR